MWNLNEETSRRYSVRTLQSNHCPKTTQKWSKFANILSHYESIHFYHIQLSSFLSFLGWKGFHTWSINVMKRVISVACLQVLLDIKWAYELAWPVRNQMKLQKPIASLVIYWNISRCRPVCTCCLRLAWLKLSGMDVSQGAAPQSFHPSPPTSSSDPPSWASAAAPQTVSDEVSRIKCNDDNPSNRC